MTQLKTSLSDLDKWFDQQKRVLPWRQRPTLYRVWISEIMLQQTQVATVIPYFQRFMKSFPSVKKLAQAPEEEVIRLWAGLGYYSRARNLHRGAKLIHQRKRFPRTREEWLQIPGVGPYTAGAIVSLALNEPEPILDGNIERVLSRLRCVDQNPLGGSIKGRLWRLSEAFLKCATHEGLEPRNFNQALMEIGATVCLSKNPRCFICPLTSICRSYQTATQHHYPLKKPKKPWKQVEEEVSCILNSEGKILLEKRGAGEWRAGLWDLPRQVNNRQTKTRNLKFLGKVTTRHVVTHHQITRKTSIYEQIQQKREKQLLQAAERNSSFEWVTPQEIETDRIAAGSALKKSLKKIQRTLKQS